MSYPPASLKKTFRPLQKTHLLACSLLTQELPGCGIVALIRTFLGRSSWFTTHTRQRIKKFTEIGIDSTLLACLQVMPDHWSWSVDPKHFAKLSVRTQRRCLHHGCSISMIFCWLAMIWWSPRCSHFFFLLRNYRQSLIHLTSTGVSQCQASSSSILMMALWPSRTCRRSDFSLQLSSLSSSRIGDRSVGGTSATGFFWCIGSSTDLLLIWSRECNAKRAFHDRPTPTQWRLVSTERDQLKKVIVWRTSIFRDLSVFRGVTIITSLKLNMDIQNDTLVERRYPFYCHFGQPC